LFTIRYRSPQDGSSECVPLADSDRDSKPQIPLAGGIVPGGSERSCPLQIHQDGVQRALMLGGVDPHGTGEVAAGMGSTLNQDAAGTDADQAGVSVGDQFDHGSRCVLTESV